MPQVQRVCPICQSDGIEVIFKNTMSAVGCLDLSYTVGCCNSCRFNFAHQLADEDIYRKYYETASKYDVANEISQIDRHRINHAAKFLKNTIGSDEMIVDIGCGFGAMLSVLRESGWSNLHGVDPAPNSANRAKILFNIDSISCATMEQAHTVVPLDQADVVCFMAVLEHLPNLRSDLSALLEKLKIGCRVLVEVPAVEHFLGENSEPFGEFSLEHIQFFTEISLRNLFQTLGWQVEKLESISLPLVGSGSIFGLFRRSKYFAPNSLLEVESGLALSQYMGASLRVLRSALQLIPKGPIMIYGAGSHSARLIPYIEDMPGVKIVAVIDNNQNLQGKKMGQWTIQSPIFIELFPDVPVLVSSFRSQHEIAAILQARYPNPVVLMYS